MRSEKEQLSAGRERSVVEIQFRDAREQDINPAHLKHKEDKKEVFTKVGGPAFPATCRIVYAARKNRHGGGRARAFQHRGQRRD